MRYKVTSKEPSHIWDYVVFKQMAGGNLISYEMKTEFAVDYAIYESERELDPKILKKFGFICSEIN